MDRRRLLLGLVAVGACAPRGAPFDGGGVRIVVGSALDPDGTLRTGRVARESDGRDAASSFATVRDLLRRTEWDVAPVVVVHLAPRVARGVSLRGPATHAATGALLLPSPTVDETAIAHELEHVAILSRRWEAPADDLARRVLSAIDEGVADFAASVSTGAAVIGDSSLGPRRDLEKPPRLSVEGWAQLATGRGFDPHALGWDLASSLHRRGRGRRELRDDATAAAATAHGKTIREIALSFIESCPARSRSTVHAAVEEWVPAEFGIE